MLNADDARTVAAVERLDILLDLAAIGRELSAVEEQFGPRLETQAARARQQRMCLDLIRQLVAWLLGSHTETVH